MYVQRNSHLPQFLKIMAGILSLLDTIISLIEINLAWKENLSLAHWDKNLSKFYKETWAHEK